MHTARGRDAQVCFPPVDGVLIREIDGQLDEAAQVEQPTWVAVVQHELLEVVGGVEDVADIGG